MLERIVAAGLLILLSIGSAGAQTAAPTQSSPDANAPALLAAVQACEAQMQRMAGLNKTFAASYDAGRIRDQCLASSREALAAK
jgi:hypothetical protein